MSYFYDRLNLFSLEFTVNIEKMKTSFQKNDNIILEKYNANMDLLKCSYQFGKLENLFNLNCSEKNCKLSKTI